MDAEEFNSVLYANPFHEFKISPVIGTRSALSSSSCRPVIGMGQRWRAIYYKIYPFMLIRNVNSFRGTKLVDTWNALGRK